MFFSSVFKEICKHANVLYQDCVSRNDISTGSTRSGLSIRHVSIDSIDIGIPQLAMHSANEVVGSDDTFYMYSVLKKYYDISLKRELDSIMLIEKSNVFVNND